MSSARSQAGRRGDLPGEFASASARDIRPTRTRCSCSRLTSKILAANQSPSPRTAPAPTGIARHAAALEQLHARAGAAVLVEQPPLSLLHRLAIGQCFPGRTRLGSGSPRLAGLVRYIGTPWQRLLFDGRTVPTEWRLLFPTGMVPLNSLLLHFVGGCGLVDHLRGMAATSAVIFFTSASVSFLEVTHGRS